MLRRTRDLLEGKNWQTLHRSFRFLGSKEAPAELAEIQAHFAQHLGHLDRYFSDLSKAPKDAVPAGVWFKAVDRLNQLDIDYSVPENAFHALTVIHHIALKRGECLQDVLPDLLHRIHDAGAFKESLISDKRLARHFINVAKAIVSHRAANPQTQARVLQLQRYVESELSH